LDAGAKATIGALAKVADGQQRGERRAQLAAQGFDTTYIRLLPWKAAR
jgi:hypothetical protein